MSYTPENAYEFSYASMGDDRYGYEGSYAFSPSWKFGGILHCHDFYEIYVHLHGAKHYCIDNSVYPVEPNQLFIMPPFTIHGLVGNSIPVEYERCFLYITAEKLKKECTNFMDIDAFLRKHVNNGQYQYQMTQEDAQHCAQLIREMMAGANDNTPTGRLGNHIRMLSFLLTVCQTVQHSPQEFRPVVVNEAMQEVLSYINDHFNQPLKLEDLARQFGVSVSYLSHKFAKYTGRSVYDYILYRRVLQAKEMINAGANLNETAYRCGFGDYSSFLRCFKKMSGMTPKNYRKMIYGNQAVSKDEE